jgi:DNA primase
MARIPDEEIERLKREVPIERLVKAAGIELRKHGADLIGRCPFHDDREPSLVVTPEKNLWHCLGACQTGGSVIDWVMRTRGVSFRHAVELLKADHPSLAAWSKDRARTRRRSSIAGYARCRRSGSAAQVVGFYHETLKQSPEALRYLESRGPHASGDDRSLSSWASPTARWATGCRTRTARPAPRCAGACSARHPAREGHEHFNGSVVIPIFSLAGDVLGMYGRKITPGLREGTPLHLYLPGPHRGVWNEEALESSKEIILCESLIDALTFWCAGFRNVTASYGVNGFTDDHGRRFRSTARSKSGSLTTATKPATRQPSG